MRKLLKKPERGQRFGMLVVLDNSRTVGRRKACECRCDCGTVKTIRNEHLAKGLIRSCGCLQRKAAKDAHTTHGGKGTRLYTIWKGMRERCNNPKSSGAKNYHDRGIRITPEWDDFSRFRKWALASGYAAGLTIDRIDVRKGYCPSNCRWASRKEQSANRRNTITVVEGGRRVRLSELSERTGISYGTLYDRMSRGAPLTEKTKKTKESAT